jgi:hypothetical protein
LIFLTASNTAFRINDARRSVDALGYPVRYAAGRFEAVTEEVVNVIVLDALLPPMS